MESFNCIQFTPSQSSGGGGLLTIQLECSLDELYRFPHTPSVVKDTLEKMVSWHTRNENTISQAIKSRHRFPQLQAVLLGLGYSVTDNCVQILLPNANHRCAASDVRSTPADEPIVSAAIGVDIDQSQTIKTARLVFCGAHAQSPYLLKCADMLVGQPFAVHTIDLVIEAMTTELSPKADYQGSAEYRLAMAAVTLKRAWTQCVEEMLND